VKFLAENDSSLWALPLRVCLANWWVLVSENSWLRLCRPMCGEGSASPEPTVFILGYALRSGCALSNTTTTERFEELQEVKDRTKGSARYQRRDLKARQSHRRTSDGRADFKCCSLGACGGNRKEWKPNENPPFSARIDYFSAWTWNKKVIDRPTRFLLHSPT